MYWQELFCQVHYNTEYKQVRENREPPFEVCEPD